MRSTKVGHGSTRPNRMASALTLGLIASLVAGIASAQQTTTNPVLPNVMLMLDTSGSFERMMDGTLPEAATASTCAAPTTSTPNRWGYLVQGLTGTLTRGYSCIAMPRSSSGQFFNEYSIGGAAPYDTGYYLPYHRPVSVDSSGTQWVYGPGALPGGTAGSNGAGSSNAALGSLPGGGFLNQATGGFPWPTGAIQVRAYPSLPSGGSGTSSPWFSFLQNSDGALDTYRDLVRLGLMTFDNDPTGGLGVTPSGTYPPLNGASAFAGQWSYFSRWNSGSSSTFNGNPINCSTQTLMELGAKSPAAPPWEGPLVGFPPPDAIIGGTGGIEAWNDSVQATINSLRPYGATPTAALLSDAQYYFWSDPAGPTADPLVSCGKRQQYMIFITDGVPNDDLRPLCSASLTESVTDSTLPPTAPCPYHLPETYLSTLYSGENGAKPPVTTYVIGFAPMTVDDQGVAVNCNSLVNGTDGGTTVTLSTACADAGDTTPFGACCKIQSLALAGSGGTQPALFVYSGGDFFAAMSAIMGKIAGTASTRTVPTASAQTADPLVSTTGSSSSIAATYWASASFAPPDAGTSDSAVLTGGDNFGDVQRRQQVCGGSSTSVGILDAGVDAKAGDDFGANLNSNAGSRATRQFLTFLPETVSGAISPTATIRPNIASTVTDGFGSYGTGGTVVRGNHSTITSGITPAALGLTTSYPTSCPTSSTVNDAGSLFLDSVSCAAMALNFTMGSSYSLPTGFPTFQSRAGNALGQILHSQPAVLPPPASTVEDPTYYEFATNPSFKSAGRAGMLFTASTDGLLHGFWTDETKLENNEYFAFLPPAVFPQLVSNYPSNSLNLLDGSPAVKDVIFDRTAATTGLSTSQWHSALVAGFGSSVRGYYALDVTDPDPVNWSSTGGPQFLWQLTTFPGSTGTTTQLFGQYSSTPAITTVMLCSGGTGDAGTCASPHEVGVAILPGGYDHAPVTPHSPTVGCTRATKAFEAQPLTSGYGARAAVNCWGANGLASDPVTGRSVSVVRIDTGEVLAVFMRAADAPSMLSSASPARVIDTGFDSPMVGTPIVVPNDVGVVGSKVFIGDADGTLWRLDLSSTSAQGWSAAIYLDLYNGTADGNGATSNWGDGQPIIIAPVQSVDPQGRVVLNVATGAQQTYGTTGTNYVYSITETMQGTTTKAPRANVNWFQKLTNGEQVTGSMTVFNSILYYPTFITSAVATGTCSVQYSKIWGVDYTVPSNSSGNGALSGGGTPLYGGNRALALTPGATPVLCFYPFDSISTCATGMPSGTTGQTTPDPVIPGVMLNQLGGCAAVGGTSTNAFGMVDTTYSATSAGSFALTWAASSKASSGANGGVATGGGSLTLATPSSVTAIDSWAAVMQ